MVWTHRVMQDWYDWHQLWMIMCDGEYLEMADFAAGCFLEARFGSPED